MNFLILWILTILSSYGVMLYTSFSLTKNIFDNGYKFITKNLKELIINDIEKMKKLDKTDLVEKRYEKFRNISGFKEV